MRVHKPFAVLFALAAGQPNPSASAQVALTSLGDLICSVGPSTKNDKATLVDSHNVTCLFNPGENGPEETYAGTLLTAGLSDELAGQPVVIWAVRGPQSEAGHAGILEQNFTGSAADADGAKGPLVGDANISVMLHLMSKSDVAKPGKPATASIELKLMSATG